MGTRGIRPNKAINIDNEPLLIVDVKAIIKKAKDDGSINNSITNIKSIIEKKGIAIEYCDDMPPSVSGKLKCINGEWTIYVNKSHHSNRRRFTMAHELAHYFLHKDASESFEDTTFFRDNSLTSIEYAANDFASQLLMPEEDVRKCINDGLKSLNKLAGKFKVSVDAMRNRIKTLGYKTQNNE